MITQEKKIAAFDAIMDLIGTHLGEWNDLSEKPTSCGALLLIAGLNTKVFYHTGYYQPLDDTFRDDDEKLLSNVKKWRYDDAEQVLKTLSK